MAESNSISAERARELFDYDPASGHLFWKACRNTKIRPGSRAGSVASNGYVVVKMKRKYYQGHRLAWLIATGEHPHGWIDHINGDRQDNRLCNLRCATPEVNAQNRRKAPNTSNTGLLGAQLSRTPGKWAACIHVNGKKRHLGRFDSPEAAHEAYINAKRRLHPGCTI